ncbi:MAG: sulfatase-like hydrolase/transferase [Xanthomonadales bacterium]|nr:sulfatase-like hydrolase/transferase [Xanthomonadales bacterium]
MSSTRKRNVLLITVDQMRYPRLRDGGGMAPDLKQVLSFQPLQADNSYAQYFPGFQRLRRNAVVMRQHMIGTSACVPSRALIYTGQYGTKTRVVETDSLYKYGSDPNFPWLNPKAIPTMGDWFRAAGYSTHYFGKWDLSYVDGPGPGHGDLNPWGFADWKMSAPDAQGGQLNQLGVYRDSGYVDMVETFLRRKAMNYESASPTPQPWLCVTSLVNPHDIASAYPLSWWMPDSLGKVPCVQTATSDTPSVRPIPSQGDRSNPLPGGRLRVPLNPRGFPQDCFSLPDTYAEDLATKPSCQFDYSYKMGLALKSRRPPDQREYWTLPFQLQDQADAWSLAFGQFYAYCHTLADTQIQRVLHALDETGLADDTLVVFLSDHGEYGVAHGGMVEKWHTAYDEILHVPFLVSAPWLNASAEQIRYVDQLTSHIDVLPTLLGLSGIEVDTLAPPAPPGQSWEPIAGQTYEPLPGADLTAVIEDPSRPVVSPDGSLREGVLFISDDTITEYLKGEQAPPAFKVYCAEVDQLREQGLPLQPGSVTEPCHIRCARTNDWKLARYFDPLNRATDQWELYDLQADPTEQNNLVHWDAAGNPVICPDRLPNPSSQEVAQLQQVLDRMQQLLAALEKQYLGYPNPVVEAFTLPELA